MTRFAQNLLRENEGKIRALCQDLAVRELRLFGSALTGKFDPSRSDLDLIAEFDAPDAVGIADRYLALAEGLEAILCRRVDLLTKPAVRNPIFRRVIDQSSQSIYAA